MLGGRLNPRWQLGDGGPGGWWILDEPELHLGRDVLVPDLAGWRRSTLPQMPETAAFAVRPDWVCEVLSPSTARLDRGPKLDAYAAAGVPWAWLVDPVERLVEVFELVDGRWMRHLVATDGEAAMPPFEAVPLNVSELWLATPPVTGGACPPALPFVSWSRASLALLMGGRCNSWRPHSAHPG